MIEKRFDVPLIARLALKEKQVQQNYRPIIAVHKWFARRPGTLFRGLLLSEFGDGHLRDLFFTSQQFPAFAIGDPFIGGGTPLFEANRLGFDVLGVDINPMACWIVQRELDDLSVTDYQGAALRVADAVRAKIEAYYQTECKHCGDDVPVKYFLWVKQHKCPSCKTKFDVWPGTLIVKDVRHVCNLVVCAKCSTLNPRQSLKPLGRCDACEEPLSLEGNYKRSVAQCPHCRTDSVFPSVGAPEHRLFAMEYHCERCKSPAIGRFFKSPDKADFNRLRAVDKAIQQSELSFVPDDLIPPGDESNRLLRWGYRTYQELFNKRQQLGLQLLCEEISQIEDPTVRAALATNLSDLVRYQNMLCRYDSMALKSLDVFSIHGFPVSLIQCESNL